MEYIRHPLYFYTNKAYTLPRVHRVRDIAMRWRSGQLEEKGGGPDKASPLSPEEEARAGYIISHGGGTRGDVRFTRLNHPIPCHCLTMTGDPTARQGASVGVPLIQPILRLSTD
jgi:hypothetical protein